MSDPNNTSSLVFAPAVKKNIQEYIELAIRSYGQYKSLLEPHQYEVFFNSFSDPWKWKKTSECTEIFECRDSDTLVGMVFYYSSGNAADIFENDWSYIRMLGVDPAYQGRGIAKTLTAMCIKKAADTNEKTLALHTSEFMDAARHIYGKSGFTQIREIPQRFGKRYWLYHFSLR